MRPIQPTSDEEYEILYYRELCGKATTPELVKLNAQREYDRQRYPFFNVLLSRKNVQILRDFETYDTVIVRGGNRSCKTTMDCFFVCCMASGYWPVAYEKMTTIWGEDVFKPILELHPKRMRIPKAAVIWVSCLDKNTQIAPRAMQDTLLTMLPPSWIKGGKEGIKRVNRIYVHSIDIVTGSQIQFKSTEMGVDKYQSAALDVAVLDELHPSTIWDEIRSRTGKTVPRILFTYYPRMGKDWTYKRFVAGKGTDKDAERIAQHTISFLDNPFISDDTKKAQLKRWERDPMKVARVGGGYIDFTGATYPNFKGFEHYNEGKPSHVFDPMKHADFIENEGKPPAAWTHIVAIDTHNSQKGASAVWCAVAPDGHRYYWQEYQSGGTPRRWAADIAAMSKGYDIERYWIDPSANATDASGFNIAVEMEDKLGGAVDWATRDRASGILAVTEALEPLVDGEGKDVDGLPAALFSRLCPITVNQMSGYSNKDAKLGNVVKEDDEMPDCVRYIEVDMPGENAPLGEEDDEPDIMDEAIRERERRNTN